MIRLINANVIYYLDVCKLNIHHKLSSYSLFQKVAASVPDSSHLLYGVSTCLSRLGAFPLCLYHHCFLYIPRKPPVSAYHFVANAIICWTFFYTRQEIHVYFVLVIPMFRNSGDCHYLVELHKSFPSFNSATKRLKSNRFPIESMSSSNSYVISHPTNRYCKWNTCFITLQLM